MKPVYRTVGLLFLMTASVGTVAMAEDETHVRDGANSATIRQSGDPADTRRSIERRPGYLRIEQHNGGNSTVIVQQSDPEPTGRVPGGRGEVDGEATPEPLAGDVPGFPRR